MSDSRFRRSRRFRPWRYSAQEVAAMQPGEDRGAFRRAFVQRPARFAVGIDVFAHRLIDERLEECTDAPLDPADYLGRVEDVAESGEVTARLWEYPSGRETTTVLGPEQIGDQKVHAGAALRIWTWMEWPREAAEPVPRLHVEVQPAELTMEEREELDALVAAMLSGSDEG